jgi:hypothetical protein
MRIRATSLLSEKAASATNAGVKLMTGLAGLVIACVLALLILILFSRRAR